MKYVPNLMSTPERISRSAQILFRTMRPRYNDLLLPEIRKTGDGFEYHVYYPRGRAIRTVMLIYGMGLAGEDDTRLLKFVRACVNAGLRVVVPNLPGLKQFLVESGDLQRLKSIANVLTRGSTEKIGLIGFSTGGSYALLLATQPDLDEKLGPLVLFSPVYDVRDIAGRLHRPVDPPPQTDNGWDQVYWMQYFIAFRNRKYLGLSQAVQLSLHRFLVDYDHYGLNEKRAFYETHIRPLNLTGRDDLLDEGEVLDVLSARGHLASVKSPVYILHDASDALVPPDHSRQMYAELAKRGAGYRQAVLITAWLSHVVMQTTGSLAELFRIVGFVSELFRISQP
jgi:pimeloyl-ACP methyl ester carboxylesterase